MKMNSEGVVISPGTQTVRNRPATVANDVTPGLVVGGVVGFVVGLAIVVAGQMMDLGWDLALPGLLVALILVAMFVILGWTGGRQERIGAERSMSASEPQATPSVPVQRQKPPMRIIRHYGESQAKQTPYMNIVEWRDNLSQFVQDASATPTVRGLKAKGHSDVDIAKHWGDLIDLGWAVKLPDGQKRVTRPASSIMGMLERDMERYFNEVRG